MNRFTWMGWTTFWILFSSLSTLGQEDLTDARLREAIQPLVRKHAGEVSVAVENLETGERYLHEADRAMPTASLIKLPVLIATYHALENGNIDLETPIRLAAEDKVPGSGVLTEHFSNGISLPLRDYVRLMIRYSDNTATNVVVDQVGLKAVAELMDSLECAQTKMYSKVYRRDTSILPEQSRRFGLGSTTAAEMVRLLAMLHRGELAGPASTESILDHLLACDDESKLARFLPDSVEFAHKTGAIANCRTDAGILYTQSGPVAVCVLTNQNEDQSWTDDNQAELLCADIGRAIVERFGSEDTSPVLRQGAFGKLVEALQRTLNQRLTPSPELAIDGDFGPATAAAVKRFQRVHDLESSGVMTLQTWEALGTLIDQEQPVASPEVVNAEQLPRLPRPPLTGPPIVTCKAWVIGDPQQGKILHSSNSDSRLEPASTTKIMTAFVVLQLAEKDPKVLDEIVTFSERADNTIGSTSGLRAGERISVRELLYGLLLPSGNDASVALAEHLGERLRTPADETAYDAFIRTMNQTAFGLGMTSTHYVNPHGLPDEAHVTSASDLFRLGQKALNDKLFRQVVNTRQYGCRIPSEQGYTRNVLWKNTNRLLEIEDYSGVKTGTTSAAGACLVSVGSYDGREWMAVVLGSSSSAARYADSRNLYRWAWAQATQR